MTHRNTSLLLLSTVLLLLAAATARAQNADSTATAATATADSAADTLKTATIGNITITARRSGTSRLGGAANALRINRDELFRAACCNLGESFTTNPSVDVNYSDAATGAKQIRLLGLSGLYVQMLAENIPTLRGAAAPFALDYVPGPWMNSIQVSKGASSVRNGYESVTGQIDIEYLKPDDDPGLTVNLYGNTLSRFEANADGNIHLNDRLSSLLLLHYQDDYARHDINHDTFQDQPSVRQFNMQNRWKYRSQSYLFHGGLALVSERRRGGQTSHGSAALTNPYKIGIDNHRYEGYMKHAFILDADHATNIALMATTSMHETSAAYGRKRYYVNEKNVYGQLMFETNIGERHNLSTGLSLCYDYLCERPTGIYGTYVGPQFTTSAFPSLPTTHYTSGKHIRETTPGAYAQYTFTLDTRLTLMAGLRADHSSLYGTFVTPRVHLKYSPSEAVALRLSAGKGYRSPHVVAESHYLLASARILVIAGDLQQEAAWNFGTSAAFNVPLFGKTMKLNLEYYHTRFSRQVVTDYDSSPTDIYIHNLRGRSYSNTAQVDATYPLLRGLELTAAYRLNDVKSTYGGQRRTKPFTSRYKSLFSASYKTPLGLWQIDATLQLNGGGRLPANIALAERFHSYEQLQAQVTRWFRHFSVYVGGENLTGFRQKHPILGAHDPWQRDFDATQVWGPVHGAVGYAGIRVNIGRL